MALTGQPRASDTGFIAEWNGKHDHNDRDEPARRESALPGHSGQIGLWALLGTITMLFAGFSSAYVLRRTAADWQPIPTPPILWLNTAVLILSSAALEFARRNLKRTDERGFKRGLLAAGILGVAFLGGQLSAWRYLADQGIFLPTNPHSSFFYLLTSVHGLHLLGGLIALGYLMTRAWQGHDRRHPRADAQALSEMVGLVSTYWHFVDGLWVYLFMLLFVI